MVKILDLIPLIQSVAILEDNVKFIEKKDKKAKDLMKQGTKNILGTTLIGMNKKIIDNFNSPF